MVNYDIGIIVLLDKSIVGPEGQVQYDERNEEKVPIIRSMTLSPEQYKRLEEPDSLVAIITPA